MTSLYAGDNKRKDGEWKKLPTPDPEQLRKPSAYVAHPDLVAAVNVALTLGQPLLLTGEPGTGKTQLAYNVAWELGLETPLKFETKSTTESRDLFYTFDTIGRFRAARAEPDVDPRPFIRLNALGRAIIHASEPKTVDDMLPRLKEKPEVQAIRSVVLIDEIDKAPRDVPNDILNEIETMSFNIPELDVSRRFVAPATMRPIVFITSNSEKALPEAFLRRCIYYHVPFPKKDALDKIVESRLGERYAKDSALIEDVLHLLEYLREPALNLRKKPATAELLDWLSFLTRDEGALTRRLKDHPAYKSSFSVSLLKNFDDQDRAKELAAGWEKKRALDLESKEPPQPQSA